MDKFSFCVGYTLAGVAGALTTLVIGWKLAAFREKYPQHMTRSLEPEGDAMTVRSHA